MARHLGICSSADTILRIIKEYATVDGAAVRILGVDDWAWRRGHRYGTVLVDLERHVPIDLLPDRESETLARWLRAHPSVQVISRDRAGAYADGARQGAPDAIQIADRFHLFCNLTEALRRLLDRLASTLHRVQLKDLPSSASAGDETVQANLEALPGRLERSRTIRHNEQDQRRQKRKAVFEAVKAAANRGLTKAAIARELGITRKTVRKFLYMDEFPERAPRRRRSGLDCFRDYLQTRWAEGCHNASQLCRELRQRGYRGQRSRVKEYVQSWRVKPESEQSPVHRAIPNLRLVAFWLSKPPGEREPDEQRWVEAVTTAHPQVAAAETLAQQFRQVFKDRTAEALRVWVANSVTSEIPELMRFAAGLERDYEAIVAAVEQPWSNGQVEGHVHRLKLLKRQMYGRGGFSLLRARVLRFQTPGIQNST